MKRVIFPLVQDGTAVVYPDDIALFSNATIIGENIVADYSGAQALPEYTGFLPSQYKPMSALDFVLRMTGQERIGIRTLALVDAVASDFMDILDRFTANKSNVYLNDPMLVQGMQYFETKNIFDADRVAELLDPTK